MLYRILWPLALGLLVVLRLGAADDNKTDKPDKPEKSLKDAPASEPKVKGKWTPVGDLTGTLKKMNGDSWTINVEYPEVQTDQRAMAKDARIGARMQQQMIRMQQQLVSASRISNPVQRAARMNQIMASGEWRAMRTSAGARSPFKVLTKKKDMDVILAKEVTVRVKEPPAEFDDKGNLKKYTSEELKRLKGPGNYWGYPGDLAAAHPGQLVHVFVYKKKSTTAKKPPAKPSPGNKTPEDDPKPEEDDDGTDPQVKVVYIVQDGGTSTKTPTRAKK